MNRLSVKTTDANGRSFELIVDDIPLAERLNDGNAAIPYWLVEDDLPCFPPQGEPRQQGIRIVTVCDCGEYGCGHTHCRVTKTNDTVMLDQFQCDGRKEPDSTRFVFSRANYEEVVAAILTGTQEQKRRTSA